MFGMEPQVDEAQIAADQQSADAMTIEAKVAGFRQDLSDVRSGKTLISEKIQGLAADLQSKQYAQGQLVADFDRVAVETYPELQGQNVDDVMASLSASHPLVVMWGDYQQKLDALSATIQDIMAQMQSLTDKLGAANDQEETILQTYEIFAAQNEGLVPSLDDLEAWLASTSSIPKVDDRTMTVPAIETLSPNAADMVMMQTADTAATEDHHDPDDMKDGEYTGDGQIYNVMSAQDQASVAASGIQPLDTGAAIQDFKPVGIAIFVGALAWIFLGGKE